MIIILILNCRVIVCPCVSPCLSVFCFLTFCYSVWLYIFVCISCLSFFLSSCFSLFFCHITFLPLCLSVFWGVFVAFFRLSVYLSFCLTVFLSDFLIFVWVDEVHLGVRRDGLYKESVLVWACARLCVFILKRKRQSMIFFWVDEVHLGVRRDGFYKESVLVWACAGLCVFTP